LEFGVESGARRSREDQGGASRTGEGGRLEVGVGRDGRSREGREDGWNSELRGGAREEQGGASRAGEGGRLEVGVGREAGWKSGLGETAGAGSGGRTVGIR
jgi:hypothetical protein